MSINSTPVRELVQRGSQKKTFRVGGPQSPFSISSSFILFFVLPPFFLKTKTKNQLFLHPNRTWTAVINSNRTLKHTGWHTRLHLARSSYYHQTMYQILSHSVLPEAKRHHQYSTCTGWSDTNSNSFSSNFQRLLPSFSFLALLLLLFSSS